MYWKVPVPSTANITVHSEVMLIVGYVISIIGIRVEPVLPVGLSRYFVSDGAQEKPFFLFNDRYRQFFLSRIMYFLSQNRLHCR
jgi:hypothetical protein